MKRELEEELKWAKKSEKEIKRFYNRLKKQNVRKLDELFHEEHDRAFEQIDCLNCANCCKTTSPIFYDKDVERMAAFFKMKPVEFFDQYLKIDEDGDQVLKSTPCPFLLDDHKCMAYEARPKACREYPHTNRKRMYQILDLSRKNTRLCPAVASITKELMKKIN